jgi:tRNA-dihydrouridine synthase B
LTILGRTRRYMFRGAAEHDTLRLTRACVTLPLIANGDIESAQQARAVLDFSGAEGVMIGRAAQGSPWIFRDVNAFIDERKNIAPLLRASKTEIILRHIESLYEFYGEYTGVRMARKHLGWYCRQISEATELRQALMAAESSAVQFAAAKRGFEHWAGLEAT